jgi:3-phosphoshikimate 1-carboxyvinyltransferase
VTTTLRADAARVSAAARLRGGVALPGDKSISHRALLLAGIASGASQIDGASDGADVRSTAGILRALGVTVERLTTASRHPGSTGSDSLPATSTAATPAPRSG